MSQRIKRLFHWPNMFTDIAKHCNSCDVCQNHTKTNPKPCPMQEQEVVSVPSERICIDFMGSFPKPKGGLEYLLTYVDVATRWPEAIPKGR